MVDKRESRRWRRTVWLAAAVVFVWAFFGVVIQMFDANLEGVDTLGFPTGYFLGVIVAPVVMLIILFSFVERQKVIDRPDFGPD
jgi:putative solute:sodium symporter small subunit